MHTSEKNLHRTLMNLTSGFTNKDYKEYRKDRNWKKYDNSTPEERLMMIIKEIKEYKNGYFEDEEFC